jgi:uracil-DNA glycosylase family 4
MRTLPLYPKVPLVALETETGVDVDAGCTRCSMHEGVRNVCLSGEGEAGGLLLVGESPGRNEDATGRPFSGEAGKLLRGLVSKWWTGPIAIDNALRCAPGKRELKDKHFDACRGFLAQTMKEIQPKRIVALGGWSAYAITGRSVAPFTTRRGYTYLVGGTTPVPVFFVLHPASALRNRFVRGWFESDLKWALQTEPPPGPPLSEHVRVVDSGETARQAIAELRQAEWSAFDVETCGLLYDPSFKLLCVSFCAKGAESPWAWDAAALADPEARAELVKYLVDPFSRKLGQNVKFDEIAIHLTLGVKPAGIRGDVRLWRKLLEPEADGKLDKMVELIGMGGMKEEARDEMDLYVERVKKGLQTEKRLIKNRAEDEEKRKRGEKVKKRAALQPKTREALEYLLDLDELVPDLVPIIRDPDADWQSWAFGLIPDDMLARYNGRDTVATARLASWLEPQLAANPELDRVRKKLVDPGARAIRAVERWGVSADKHAILAFDRFCDVKLIALRAKLDAQAGKDFDADSPKQVGELLFGKLGLPSIKLTKSGNADSTDGDVLEELKDLHPVVGVLIDWRSYSKLKGTYASGMLPYVRADGRIHTSILLDGARSGRTSSSKPNLQNIPRAADSIEGKMARDCFIAPDGFTLVQLDYSQLELRIAAALSGDPKMISIFKEGVDYHQRTAELISKIAWGIQPSQVEKKHRSMAKSVNFGILYGKTARTLAKEWGVPVGKAEEVVAAIMGQFSVLAAWCKDRLRESQRTGVSWTWWDGQKARRRPLWRIADQDDALASRARNGAVNTPIQGSASDFCIASLIECVEWIESGELEDRCRLVLPVHDSLLFEVRNDFVDEAVSTVRDIMLSWNSNGVPLEVDMEQGPAWGSLEKIKLAA